MDIRSDLGTPCYLVGDPVDLFVLLVDFGAHVHRHRFQVADESADGVQVVLHLVFAGVIGYPETLTSLPVRSAVTENEIFE